MSGDLQVALDRIAAERAARTGVLNLSTLTLDRLPRELADLTDLRVLDCSYTQVSGLVPLAKLTRLQQLNCSRTQVSDLAPLAKLTRLQQLDCWRTQVSDLAPLAKLIRLQQLDCSWTQVRDLAPLAKLTRLQQLDCSVTEVSDLVPLAKLPSLQQLDCWHTQVTDLAPLAKLPSLQQLNCSVTEVSDLAPLAKLPSLQQLDCSVTQVSDLEPLAALAALSRLTCAGNSLSAVPWRLIDSRRLVHLNVQGSSLPGIPSELLDDDNALSAIRAHLRDLADGGEELADVKVMVLGNGRIGKTQICRRLRGEPFEEEADSTHGVVVTTAQFSIPSDSQPVSHGNVAPARLHLWDFGGQDLYHGTHVIFLTKGAVYLVVWCRKFEQDGTHEYRGVTFRNHRLPYWVAHVRNLAGPDNPLLLIQNQCDNPEDEAVRPPIPAEDLEAFRFRKNLHYSARLDRGRGALNEAIEQALEWLRSQRGSIRIGRGRLEVRRRLEDLRNSDAALPPAQRRYRTISLEHYQSLCQEAGGVSSPELLLDYLHATSTVFYRRGFFDNRIILDQAWALDAIYAVFHRERCHRFLVHARGRFTRSVLDLLIWQELGHSSADQDLFLSMMQSCAMCFVHRPADGTKNAEAEYIVPELLPPREDVQVEIDTRWKRETEERVERVRVPFLHPGLMPAVISTIGEEARMTGVYWQGGVLVYDRTTMSHAMIEEQRTADAEIPTGGIVIRTQQGQADSLLEALTDRIRDVVVGWYGGSARIDHAPTEHRRRSQPDVTEHPLTESARRELDFTDPPRPEKRCYVSYAWNDESDEAVDTLCRIAEERGIRVIRDKSELRTGDRIGDFMRRLAAGDLVFVIVSDKYLRSPFCMYELHEIWRNCRQDAGELRDRIRVFRLPDAAFQTPIERLKRAAFWQKEFQDLDAAGRTHGFQLLGQDDFHRYKCMKDFALHVGDILATVADMVLPATIDELASWGFDE